MKGGLCSAPLRKNWNEFSTLWSDYFSNCWQGFFITAFENVNVDGYDLDISYCNVESYTKIPIFVLWTRHSIYLKLNIRIRSIINKFEIFIDHSNDLAPLHTFLLLPQVWGKKDAPLEHWRTGLNSICTNEKDHILISWVQPNHMQGVFPLQCSLFIIPCTVFKHMNHEAWSWP